MSKATKETTLSKATKETTKNDDVGCDEENDFRRFRRHLFIFRRHFLHRFQLSCFCLLLSTSFFSAELDALETLSPRGYASYTTTMQQQQTYHVSIVVTFCCSAFVCTRL